MTKVVLCRPEGGINDILCRISLCYSYCRATNRILLIDTINTSFRQPLNIYFKSRFNDIQFITSNQDLPPLDSVYPLLDKNGFSYQAIYKNDLGFVRSEDESGLHFDLNRTYQEEVLLYHNCGGGNSSHHAFSFLDFQDFVKQAIGHLYQIIPKPYISLHLRGTDGLGTNFPPLIALLASLPRQNLFVATDSKQLLDLVIEKLSSHNLFTYSAQSLEYERPLHVFKPDDPLTHDRSKINLNTFIDLGLLALAESYFYVDPLIYGGWVSGFSNLAAFLHKNKHFLLSN